MQWKWCMHKDMLSLNRKKLLNLLLKNAIYDRNILYHSAIAAAPALDCDATQHKKQEIQRS